MMKSVGFSVAVFLYVFTDILAHGIAATLCIYIGVTVLYLLVRKPLQRWCRKPAHQPPPKPSVKERMIAAKQLAQSNPEGRAYISELLRMYPNTDFYDWCNYRLTCARCKSIITPKGELVHYLTFSANDELFNILAK